MSDFEEYQPNQKKGQVKKKNDKNSFRFYGPQNNPDSLVMLKPINKFIYLFYDVHVAIMVESRPQYRTTYRSYFEKYSDTELLCFSSAKEALDRIKDNLKQRKITVLAYNQFIGDVMRILYPVENVEQIVCIHTGASKSKSQNNQKINFHIYYRDDLKQYFMERENQKRKEEVLPNMIALNQEGASSCLQLQTMKAMLNQKTHRSSMIEQFTQLLRRIHKKSISAKCQKEQKKLKEQYEKQLKKFSADMSQQNNEENGKLAIKFYTKDSLKLYKVLNNLLRASNDCTELFYCQPFFKDLFYGIKNIYEAKKEDQETFQCYRGAYASQTEIKFYRDNKGHFIQNLGFLSASRQREVAKRFAKNLIIIIIVEDEERDEVLDFGYADIYGYSSHKTECEVLFNPLNTFKIKQVEKNDQQKKQYVTLEYGALSKLMKSQAKHLNIQQEIYFDQGTYLAEEMNNQMGTQGDLFLKSLTSLSIYQQNKIKKMIDPEQKRQEGVIYWKEYLKYQKEDRGIIKAHYELGAIYCLNGKFQIAKQHLKIVEDLYKKDYDNNQNMRYDVAQLLFSIRHNREALILEDSLIRGKIIEYGKVQHSIGKLYFEMGKYKHAESIFHQCLMRQQKIHGKQSQSSITTNYCLAEVLYEMGRYKEARQVIELCVGIQQKICGKNHPKYIFSQFQKAKIQFRMGNLKGALELCQKTLKREKEILGRLHPQYINIQQTIAQISLELGNHKEALNLLKECDQLQQKIYRNNKFMSISTKHLIAQVLRQTGQYSQPLKIYHECLSIQEEAQGRNHPKYWITKWLIAHIKFEMGQYSQALLQFSECLEGQQNIFGKMDLKSVSTNRSIAQIKFELGHYQQALQIYEKCQQIQEEFLGKYHPESIITRFSIAQVYTCNGYNAKALDIIQQYQPDSYKQNKIMYHRMNLVLANAEFEAGKYHKALEIYEKCLEINGQIYGENHARFVSTKYKIAEIYIELSQYKEAGEMLDECLTIQEKLLGKQHPKYLKTQLTKIRVLIATQKYDVASLRTKKCLQIQQDSLNENLQLAVRTRITMAEILVKQREIRETLKILMELNDNYKQALEGHPWDIDKKNLIGKVASAMGQYQLAITMNEKCLIDCEKFLDKNHPKYFSIKNNRDTLQILMTNGQQKSIQF